MRKETILVASGLLVGLTGGLGIGYRLYSPKTVLETPLPAIRQEDGSLVLERKPDAKAKPKQTVPDGATVDRVISVELETVQPITQATLDLTLVSLPDGSKRVIASSPNGTVTGGIDIPVAPNRVPVDLKWAAGGVYSPSEKKYGAFIQYQNGPYLAQAVVIGSNITVGVGLRW